MKSFRICSVILFGLVSIGYPVQAQDQGAPKSEAAMKAKADYVKETKKLEDAHLKKLEKLREQYMEELENARLAALEKKNLNEAQLILAELKSLQEDAKSGITPDRGFNIFQARWGAKGTWTDVTTQVRKQIKNGRLSIIPEKANLGDPVFGEHKTLVVVYSYAGKVGVEITQWDKQVNLPPKGK